jgi:hypothetical protein
MSFYEDFIAEGHACAGCMEFFFEEAVDGVLYGVGGPRLCASCQRTAEKERDVYEQNKQAIADKRAKKKPR